MTNDHLIHFAALLSSDVTLTICVLHRQSPLKGALDAAPALLSRLQVVTRAVERSVRGVANVIAVARDLQTEPCVEKFMRNGLVARQCDVRDRWI